MLPRILGGYCLLACLCAAHATAADTDRELSQSPQWLALLHYHPDTFSGLTSQADDDDFFLSPAGKHSPEAELEAMVSALRGPESGRLPVVCRFPARTAWLRAQQAVPMEPATSQCEKFTEWRENLNARAVTLVFAASYLNSPSSMFGHTFLRLDPPIEGGKEPDLLLAYTISYAADAGARDNELTFAYKGIFGGYPGITTTQPYYEKIRLYTDIENRDLWEYTLNLTPAEVDQLVAHAWEIQGINFDYYFFDENCAYRLLALLDVARPGTNLLGRVSTHAIPSDTVRWVVDEDLVESIHFRPSAASKLSYQIEQIPSDEQSLTYQLAHGAIDPDAPEIGNLLPSSRAAVLDAAYEYLRYLSDSGMLARSEAAPRSHDLLVARSRIAGQPQPPEPPAPEIRDDQGHDTFRAGIAAGRQFDRDYVQLSLRPSYHDLLDPPAGYREGAQLQFLAADFRQYLDDPEFQLEKLTAIEIRSLTPRNRFFSPTSWQVGFGARRTLTEQQRPLTPYLDGGAGYSWKPIDSLQLYAIGTADLEIDDDLGKGYDFAPGADLGLLHQGNRFSFQAGLKSKYWLIASRDRIDDAYLSTGLHLGRSYRISASAHRQQFFGRYDTSWQLGFFAYF